MKDNDDGLRLIRHLGDGCLAGVLAAIIILIYAFLMLGCASTCPPCQPRIETVEVKIPVYSCPSPPTIDPIVLPSHPQLTPQAPDDELKAWYAEMVATIHSREQMCLDYIEYLIDLLEEYRQPE